MKIIIILGNGFDISFGLKTKYTDFYYDFLMKNQDHYNIFMGENQAIHRELVTMIKDNKDVSYWSDLELLIGRSLELFSSIDTLQKEKAYLEQSLNEYLKKEQERILKPLQ